MKVVLATGIYPPDIGGPATYVRALALELARRGVSVSVVTYGKKNHVEHEDTVPIVCIAKWGMVLRWFRYARALRKHAGDADIVYAFSTVSAGVPLLLSRLKKPRRLLRLGGDFMWERYTDHGGKLGLRAWYESRPLACCIVRRILKQFHHILFSTRFQEEIYEGVFTSLPPHSVLENAVPEGSPQLHHRHEPLRLLFLGRFVGFKNLTTLLRAVVKVPGVRLTLIGCGPLERPLKQLVGELLLDQRVTFLGCVQGDRKAQVFQEYDLLILPSLTEISPHVALEARAGGLPVLLTEQTGLSAEFCSGMKLLSLRSTLDITRALVDAISRYASLAEGACRPLPKRTWASVADEHLALFQKLL